MPVRIGTPVHGFSDPLGLLSDCHRRIELFLGHLETAGKAMDLQITPEIERILEAALKYFREAAPKHTADEENSLFPRLRNSGVGAEQVLTRLELLEHEHRHSLPLHAEVERLGTAYLMRGILTASEAESFRAAVDGLLTLYREHIFVEDTVVFPAASTLLSAEDKDKIGKEMAARRESSTTLPEAG